MGFKDTWRRSLEYFGLVEGDYIEEGEYYDEADTGTEMLDETSSPREPAPVSSIRGSRRGRDDDIDDIFFDREFTDLEELIDDTDSKDSDDVVDLIREDEECTSMLLTNP